MWVVQYECVFTTGCEYPVVKCVCMGAGVPRIVHVCGGNVGVSFPRLLCFWWELVSYAAAGCAWDVRYHPLAYVCVRARAGGCGSLLECLGAVLWAQTAAADAAAAAAAGSTSV